ncbi:MAG: ImuA family protein [Acidobacteriota bacterium]|jgi:protein ImuA
MVLSAANTLAALRRDIASLEAVRPASRTRHYRLDCEPALFRAAGGSIRGALHEIAAARETEIAAATGFALSLAACATSRAILWVGEDMACVESGALYGPGLDLLGIAPERFIVVRAVHLRDVLWTMEEALHCSAVGAVIGESRAQRCPDLIATRRLSLAAPHNNSIALLLRTAPGVEPSAAATRWVIGASPSAPHAHGSPRLKAQLMRNRFGEPGSWMLDWNDDEKCFGPASADRKPLAQTAFDRPRRAAASA